MSAGVHAALAGQHGDGVAEGDVPVPEEAPLAAAVLVESGQGPGIIVSGFGHQVFGFVICFLVVVVQIY